MKEKFSKPPKTMKGKSRKTMLHAQKRVKLKRELRKRGVTGWKKTSRTTTLQNLLRKRRK